MPDQEDATSVTSSSAEVSSSTIVFPSGMHLPPGYSFQQDTGITAEVSDTISRYRTQFSWVYSESFQ